MSVLRFSTADGVSLEGELRPADGSPRGTAVLCHPHPKYGGSKDHPVLWAIRNDLAGKRDLTVLAFNFRGVMGSEGSYGGGEAELSDVAAAVDRVRQEADGPTILVGWSFGAWVALRHALASPDLAALILVAIPVGRKTTGRPLPELGNLEGLTIPTLFVAGDSDDICPVDAMRSLSGWIPGARNLVIEDTGHSFGRRERELAVQIGEWVGGVLSG